MNAKNMKRLQQAANIGIVVVTLLIAVVLSKDYVLNRVKTSAVSLPEIGSTIKVPDVDWSKHRATILLVLQKDCRYCAKSAPFYRRLITESSNERFHLMAVLPQVDDQAQQYLRELDLPISDTRQLMPAQIGVPGTPMLFILDRRGVIKGRWFGALSGEQEGEVLNAINSLPIQ
jgi:thioredoxin-related protein